MLILDRFVAKSRSQLWRTEHSKTKTRVLGNAAAVLGVKLKRELRILVIFQNRLCSATSPESLRGDLSNDVAEHRRFLKNSQNTYCPRFNLTPKTGLTFPKTCFFYGPSIKLESVGCKSSVNGCLTCA